MKAVIVPSGMNLRVVRYPESRTGDVWEQNQAASPPILNKDPQRAPTLLASASGDAQVRKAAPKDTAERRALHLRFVSNE